MAFRVYANGGQPFVVPAGTPAAPGVQALPDFTTPSLVADNLLGALGPDTISDDLNVATGVNARFFFIAFVLLGPAPVAANQPTLRVTIGNNLANPAESVSANLVSPGPVNLNYPGTGLASEVASYLYGPNANGVYLAKLALLLDEAFWPSPWNWRIEILNRDAIARSFVAVMGSSSAETRQSWLHLTPTSIAFSALVNDPATLTEQTLTLNNFGTGPLSGIGFSPALANPYVINDPLPASVAPNSSASIGLGFAAVSAIGTLPASAFTLTSNDPQPGGAPLHNQSLSLSATTRRIETTMVLDVSGSMRAQPNGIYGGDLSANRLSVMKSAAKLAGDALSAVAAAKGNVGLVRFPGTNPSDITTYNTTPARVQVPIPALGTNTFSQPINALTASGGTPLRLGLQWASQGGFFETEASEPGSTTLNDRWLLLMTDGDWNNGGNPHPTMTAELGSKLIKVFAMGYGTGGEYNPAILSTIATGAGAATGGQVTAIDTLLDPLNQAVVLANAFKSAIKATLSSSADAPRDPAAVLTSGDREQRHSIIVTPYDTRAVFMINWNTNDPGRMSLRLITPTCDLITPESAAAGEHPGVTFSDSERHQIFAVDQSYLAGASTDGGTSPRYGTWRMVVSSDTLGEEGDREHYSYDCIVISSLHMETTLDRDQYYAGDTINMRARLTLKGRPLTGASVTVRVTRPGQAFANWLAATSVSQRALVQAQELMQGNEASPIYLKAVAATKVQNLKFHPGTFSRTITLTDSDGDGVYTGSFSDTSVPEEYSFYVVGVGSTADGVVYRRERELKRVLGVRPQPEFTLFDLRYLPVAGNPSLLQAMISVTPRDQFGNVMLFDPSQGGIALEIEGGRLSGRLATAFDGTYTVPVVYERGGAPRLGLRVGEQAIFAGRVLPQIEQLTFVDQVFEYRPGGVRRLESNRFADAQAVLGDVTQRPDESFLALGGHGSISVGVQGHVIAASGEADVTVFAPQGIERRPYLVEALAVGDKLTWVTLGQSPGGTQSFSLKEAGLKAAQAIRVSDRSGRTTDERLEPLEAPGVCVLGIGVNTIRRGKGNLLRNPEFARVGAQGPTVRVKLGGQPVLTPRVGDFGQPSAAADWASYALREAEVVTELMSGAGPREAPTIMRVATDAEGAGITQVFETQERGPKRAVVSAWVYVLQGRVGLGAGAALQTKPSTVSRNIGRWELLSTRSTGEPVNQVVLLATEQSTVFYVASAELIAADE